MRTLRIPINNALEKRKMCAIPIGYSGENNVTEITFDISEWIAAYGVGTTVLQMLRPSDSAWYDIPISADGADAAWLVSNTDTSFSGTGRVVLAYYVNEQIAKSAEFTIEVLPSSNDGGDAPEPWEGFADRMAELAAQAEQSADDARGYASDASGYSTSASTYADEAERQAGLAAGYVDAAEAQAIYAEECANNAEAWADGKKYGEPVPSTAPQHNNNAKYYAEDASASASAASDSADAAAASASAMQTSGAEVGDLIKVKTVDGDGKPIAWEAQKITSEPTDITNENLDIPTATAVYWAAVDPIYAAPINNIADPHAGDLVFVKSVQDGVITAYEAVTPPRMEIGVEYAMPGEYFLGKQVYGQIVSVTMPSSGTSPTQTTIDVSSVDRMVSCDAWIYNANNGVTYSLPYNDGSNVVYVSATGRGTLLNQIFVIVRVASGSSFYGMSAYAFIKYTK